MPLKDIDQIKNELTQGKHVSAVRDLDTAIADPAFDKIDGTLRARYLRMRGSLAINLEENLDLAEALSKEAAAFDASEDQNIFESRITLMRDGPAAALAVLDQHGIKSLVFRSALRYISGDTPGALAILEAVSDVHKDDVEMHRLLAVLRLASHNRAIAELEAERAYAIAPNDIQVRFTLGVVNYFACFPQSLIPVNIESAPEPMPEELLTLDKDAVAKMRRAAELFDECLRSLEYPDPLLQEIELWKLAALASDPQRRGDAAINATSLLYRALPNHRAVQWVSAYGLKVGLQPWIDKGHSDLATGTISPNQRHALAWLAMEEERYDEAVALLATGGPIEAERDRINRKLLLSRSYAEQHLWDEAIDVLNDEDNVDVTRLRAMLDEQKKEAAKRGADGFHPTTDAMQLLADSRKAAASGDWKVVADHADELLSKLPNRIAARVALLGIYNTKQFAKFLKVYDEVAGWSGLDKESSIRRARISALWNDNRRTEALAEAGGLFSEEPSATNGDSYGRILLEAGDYGEIAKVARKIVGAQDLTAEIALRSAAWLQNSHQGEAAALWDKAIELGVGDDLVTLALSIAYRVGRDRSTKALVQRMQGLAERGVGGVSSATFEQVIDVLGAAAKNDRMMSDQYRFGSLPIHIIGDQIRLPLFMSHYAQPESNESALPSRWVNIYVRHGARGPLLTEPLFSDRILNMDITSLLMSQYIGCLPVLRGKFKTIAIPDLTESLLYDMKDHIAAAQPSRIDQMRYILQTSRSGGIDQVPANDGFAWADRNGALYVTSLPVRDQRTGKEIPATDAVRKTGVNLPRLVAHLENEGTINSWQRQGALESMGSEGALNAAGVDISKGARLLVGAPYLEMLQETYLVAALLGAGYRLYISDSDVAYLESEVARADQRTRVAKEVQALVDIVRDGLSSAAFISRHSERRFSDPSNYNGQSIVTLLAEAQDGEILLVDDRYCNRHRKTDKDVHVMSTFDVLSSMNSAGEVEHDEYDRILTKARAGGLLFLPPSSDEVVRLLNSAKVRDGALLESPDLRILRRYLGAALKQPGLHLIVGADDEREFLRTTDAALQGAARTVSSMQDGATKQAYVLQDLGGVELSALRKAFDESRLDDMDDAMRSLHALSLRLMAE